jgi:uncharacterized membrane protein
MSDKTFTEIINNSEIELLKEEIKYEIYTKLINFLMYIIIICFIFFLGYMTKSIIG